MQGGYIRQERPYVTFAALFVSEKYDERKVTLCLYGGSKPPPYSQNPNIANKQNKNYTSVFRQRTDFTHARPAFIAGVQTMRARICSAFSCDMFARVVWLRFRRAAKLPTFALPFTARTCHAWLARLTRARGVSSQREGNALFADFWYFSSLKSTISTKNF